jgi:hypothetical protein
VKPLGAQSDNSKPLEPNLAKIAKAVKADQKNNARLDRLAFLQACTGPLSFEKCGLPDGGTITASCRDRFLVLGYHDNPMLTGVAFVAFPAV